MTPEKIAQIAQIASVLEVSGYPKPGNVHRTRDFHDMTFEDFLISGVVIGDTVKKAVINGEKIKTSISFGEAKLGKFILEAVNETNKWISNNTNLGIIMMLMPIAISASISKDLNELKKNIGEILINTTVEDSINLYDAIKIADAGGMGNQKDFDVTDDNAKEELIANNQTMFDVLKISSSWDSLANELTSRMPIVFEIGYPTFSKLKKNFPINLSTVITFLTILSNVPDTLISRKYGNEKAEEVSAMSNKILMDLNINLSDSNLNNYDLNNFNLSNSNSNKPNFDYHDLKKKYNNGLFNKMLTDFDDFLFKNKLNPGTTADLTAASIMVSYLNDFL
jgi:triphosphoribosyl-dephospho-CoA synthase